MSAPPSTGGTRWGAPILVILAGVALSTWVLFRLPQGPNYPISRKLAVLYGLPSIALLALIGFRLVVGKISRSGDLIITWLVSFFIGVHILLVGAATQLFGDANMIVPLGSAALLLGLASPVAALEPGSVFGLRVRATLADPEVWKKTHRVLGIGFAATGFVCLLGLAFPPRATLILVVAGPAVALLLSALYARLLGSKNPQKTEDEDPRPEDRPNP